MIPTAARRRARALRSTASDRSAAGRLRFVPAGVPTPYRLMFDVPVGLAGLVTTAVTPVTCGGLKIRNSKAPMSKNGRLPNPTFATLGSSTRS